MGDPSLLIPGLSWVRLTFLLLAPVAGVLALDAYVRLPPDWILRLKRWYFGAPRRRTPHPLPVPPAPPDWFHDPALRDEVETRLSRKLTHTRLPWNLSRPLQLMEFHLDAGRGLKPSTVRVLLKILALRPNDPYSERAVALTAEVLGKFDCREATPLLLELIHSESDLVRYHAIEALGMLRAPEAQDWIDYIATHDFLPSVRRAASESSRRIHAVFPY